MVFHGDVMGWFDRICQKGFICKTLTHLDPNILECICSEFGSGLVSIDHPIKKLIETTHNKEHCYN